LVAWLLFDVVLERTASVLAVGVAVMLFAGRWRGVPFVANRSTLAGTPWVAAALRTP
jgi:hypothetical protein